MLARGTETGLSLVRFYCLGFVLTIVVLLYVWLFSVEIVLYFVKKENDFRFLMS